MKNVTLLLAIVFLLIIIPYASAANPFIVNQNTLGLNIDPLIYPSVQQNQPFTLNVHVYNISNGLNMTNNSVNCYAHLYDAVGDTLVRTPLMWDNQTDFDATLNANNFSQLGQHSLEIWCNSDGILGGYIRAIFDVTTNGDELSIPASIMYGVSFIILVLIFILLLYGALNLKWKNEYNEEGYSLVITKQKYGKIMCMVGAYVTGLFILYLAWATTSVYLQFTTASRIFNYFFYIAGWAILPISVLAIFLMIVNWVTDKRIKEAARRGMKWRPK